MNSEIDTSEITNLLDNLELVESEEKELFPEQKNPDESPIFNVFLTNPDAALTMCAEYRKWIEYKNQDVPEYSNKKEWEELKKKRAKRSDQYLNACIKFFDSFKLDFEKNELKTTVADASLLHFYHLANNGYFAIIHKDPDVQNMKRRKAKEDLFFHGWDKKYESWMEQFND